MIRIISIYAGLFVALTYGDYWTTDFAITNGLAEEFNPAVRDGATAYKAMNMIWINIAFLLGTSGMLYWAMNNKSRASGHYLNHPLRASFNWFYLNPFSDKNVAKSPLHLLAFPLCCLFAKAFAITSNALGIIYGSGLAEPLVALLNPYLGGTILYVAVTGIIITPFWILSLYIAASAVRGSHDFRAAAAVI